MRNILLLFLVLILTGCDGERDASGPGGKLKVVATTTLVGDLVRQIAGDHVDLAVIMAAGVDPHTFKPSTQDLGNVAAADLVFFNGLHLEGKMVDLFEEKLAKQSVAVTRDIPVDRLLGWSQGQSGAHDPHIWFDASLWRSAAQTVRDTLVERDAKNASAYQAAHADLDARLASLDAEMRSKLATVPEGKRVLITSHDAYNYFGKAYAVEVRGLQGISTETEAGLASINAAVDFILQRKIPAIFVESSVSHKSIERVQADVRARGFDVKIGGELYSDALGAVGEHAGFAVDTYEGMFRYNVETIVRSLTAASNP